MLPRPSARTRAPRTPGRLPRTAPVLPLVAGAVLLAGCSGVPGVYTVENDADAAAAASEAAFDPTGYVDDIWDSEVLPAAEDGATDAATLLAALAADKKSAAADYGVGGTSTYLVTATGTVTAVDTSGSSGTLGVDVDGDGTADLTVALGPVYIGTAVRDAMDFIDFSQFSNQIDYADVGTAMNTKVREEVVPAAAGAAAGDTVTVTGAATVTDPTKVSVVPIELEVGA